MWPQAVFGGLDRQTVPTQYLDHRHVVERGSAVEHRRANRRIPVGDGE